MITKFHVNDEGRALSCEASAQDCRFSDNVGHHNTEVEARQAYEEKQELQISSSLKKNELNSPKRETFEDVKNTITEEDTEYGLQRVMRFVGSREGKKWKDVMGTKRKSKNNIKKYDDFLRDEVNADKELLSKAKEEAAANAKQLAYDRFTEMPGRPLTQRWAKD